MAEKLKLALEILALTVLISSTSSLNAQDRWQIDSSNSVARIYLGSRDNLFQVGVARINGQGPVIVGIPVDYRDNHNLMENVHLDTLN